MGRHEEGWKLRGHDGGNLTVRFRHQGKRYEFSTGTADRQEAEREAKRIYAQHVLGQQKAQIVALPPLQLLIGGWLASRENTLSEQTLGLYELYAKAHWLPFFVTAERISALSIKQYTNERLGRVQRRTVAKELSALNGFAEWLADCGYIAAAPKVAKMGRRSVGHKALHHAKIALTPTEAAAIIAELPERSRRGHAARAFFIVAWETGLRPATLFRISAADYEVGKKVLNIPDSADKARFGREIPLSKQAQRALDSVCGSSGIIFPRWDYRGTITNAAIRAGMNEKEARHIGTYGFRRGRLRSWIDGSGGDLRAVAFLAGHKSVTTTAVYLNADAGRASDLVHRADD